MKFSVSICVYKEDYPPYFNEALDSLIKQKLKPNEIVIVVDGPIGVDIENILTNFEEIVYKNNIELKIVRLNKNMGHGKAREMGIKNCSYDLVAIADADDLNHPNRFFYQVEYFKTISDASVVGGQMLEIDAKTKKPIAFKIYKIIIIVLLRAFIYHEKNIF